jgi:hypothetical protein
MDQEPRIINQRPVRRNAPHARQVLDRARIRYVLFGGMALAALAFVLMFLPP